MTAGKFSHMDFYTVTKFHILLGKMQQHSHSLFNEGLGAHAPLDDTVQWWINAIHDGREDTKDSLCTCNCNR
jgi:hypothetical protein